MKSDGMLWMHYLYLGENMWGDSPRPSKLYPAQCGAYDRRTNKINTDMDTWYRVVDQLPSFGINSILIDVGEGLKYDSHPELAVDGSLTHDELKKLLDYIRSLGMEPLPKLNFSACHDTWLGEYSRMVSTQTYYQVAKDVISEVCEVFGKPRLFHLGMDEEDYPDHHTSITSIRSDDLWWHDLYFLFDEVEKHGARPWIWSDYFWKHQEGWEKKMPKDCVQSNWYYDRMTPKGADGKYPQVAYQTYIEFAKMGYDQIPGTSDWNNRQNLAETVWLWLTENICDEHLLGFATLPWEKTTDLNYYTHLNNANRMKYAKAMFEEYTPEKREEMCRRQSPRLIVK